MLLWPCKCIHFTMHALQYTCFHVFVPFFAQFSKYSLPVPSHTFKIQKHIRIHNKFKGQRLSALHPPSESHVVFGCYPGVLFVILLMGFAFPVSPFFPKHFYPWNTTSSYFLHKRLWKINSVRYWLLTDVCLIFTFYP